MLVGIAASYSLFLSWFFSGDVEINYNSAGTGAAIVRWPIVSGFVFDPLPKLFYVKDYKISRSRAVFIVEDWNGIEDLYDFGEIYWTKDESAVVVPRSGVPIVVYDFKNHETIWSKKDLLALIKHRGGRGRKIRYEDWEDRKAVWPFEIFPDIIR